MNFTVETLYPGVIHLSFGSQEAVNLAMVRIAEFYESPYDDIRAHKFSVQQFEGRWDHDHDKCYYDTWHGHNVPGHVVSNFFKVFDGDLRPIEKEIERAIGPRSEPYYLIVTWREDEVQHELAHALYYLDAEYRTTANRLLMAFSVTENTLYRLLLEWLQRKGYCDAVLSDEMNAYLATTPVDWWIEEEKFFPSVVERIARSTPPFEALFHRTLTAPQPCLTVALEGEGKQRAIVIRLPLSVLQIAAQAAPFIHDVADDMGESDFRIVDKEKFGQEVVLALCDEQEDGTTLVHEMFDDAAEWVVDQGGEGFVWPAAGVTEDR